MQKPDVYELKVQRITSDCPYSQTRKSKRGLYPPFPGNNSEKDTITFLCLHGDRQSACCRKGEQRR